MHEARTSRRQRTRRIAGGVSANQRLLIPKQQGSGSSRRRGDVEEGRSEDDEDGGRHDAHDNEEQGLDDVKTLDYSVHFTIGSSYREADDCGDDY